MRRRFFWSLFGGVAATLLIVTVLGALVTLSAVRAQSRDEMRRQVTQIVEIVQEALVSDGVDLAAANVRDVLSEPGVPTVRRVLLEAGRVVGPEAEVRLVAVTPAERILGRELPEAVVRKFDFDAVLSGNTMAERVSDPRSGGVVEVVARSVGTVGDSDAVLAAVILRQSDVFEMGPILRQMVFPLLVAALVAAFGARRLATWLLARLSRLSEAAGRLADGDLEARAVVEGADEITDLARSFNEMADQMEATRDREREFLMSVGHDLRTPLTTVSGYVEVLESGDVDPGEIRRIAGVLDRETTRLRRLIEDLMLLARLEAREFSVRREPVEVVAHLRGTVDGFRPRAEAAHVSLVYEPEGDATVLVDPDRLDQIVSNLIENALRYTPETGTVTVGLNAGVESVRLRIQDTGTGIHADDLPHIFEKFYVARKYRRVRPEGSGLGLAIVREIVEAMGGTITADSGGESGGTTITVHVPVQAPNPSTM